MLVGGHGRRLGGPKDVVAVGGRPMVDRVEDALAAAGAVEVLRVGGPDRPDPEPGQGPLAGIRHALDLLDHEIVVVAACDLPFLTAGLVRSLVDAAGPGCDAVVPTEDGHRVGVCAAYRSTARPRLERAYASGTRAVQAALDELRVVELGDLDPAALADVDTPDDLARARRRAR